MFKNKLFIFLMLSLILFPSAISPITYAFDGLLPTYSIVENTNSTNDLPTYKTAISSIETIAPIFTFQSRASLLMEVTTGKILYENNSNDKCYPASVTKIMTLILIMDAIADEKIAYDSYVTCSENAESMGGSQIWFETNEQITIDEAIKSICIASANDVCVAMAELLAGTEGNFVNMMNERAKALGMTSTNFINSHGLHDDNHYTTATDIAIMSKELITKYPHIFTYTSTWMDSIRNGEFELTNTNSLINTYEGCNGLKTGFTEESMYNLSATATRDGLSLIAIAVGAPTISIRSEEIKQLLNYGFTNFSIQKLVTTQDALPSIKVPKHIQKEINVYYEEDVNVVVEKGQNIVFTSEIEYYKDLTVPLKPNSVVAKASFFDENNTLLSQMNIITKEYVLRSTFLDYFNTIFSYYGIYGLKI